MSVASARTDRARALLARAVTFRKLEIIAWHVHALELPYTEVRATVVEALTLYEGRRAELERDELDRFVRACLLLQPAATTRQIRELIELRGEMPISGHTLNKLTRDVRAELGITAPSGRPRKEPASC